MQFVVMMRDGSRYGVEAAYIEVVSAEASSYTLLGPVPGYDRAILATFPVDLVAAIVPLDQIDQYLSADDAQRQMHRGGTNEPLRSPEEQAFEMSGWSATEADF